MSSRQAETAGRLICRGVTESAAGEQCVRLQASRCRGCDGRCGLALFAPPRILLDADAGIADGVAVEVVAAARRCAWRALGVFGIPLAVALAAAAAVDALAWPDWPIALAPLAAIAAMLGARRAWPAPARQPVVERESEIVRIRID